MKNLLNDVESSDLISIYQKIKKFMIFLDNEYKNTEKMRDENE